MRWQPPAEGVDGASAIAVFRLVSLFREDADVVGNWEFRLLLLANLSPPLGTSLVSPLLDTLTPLAMGASVAAVRDTVNFVAAVHWIVVGMRSSAVRSAFSARRRSRILTYSIRTGRRRRERQLTLAFRASYLVRTILFSGRVTRRPLGGPQQGRYLHGQRSTRGGVRSARCRTLPASRAAKWASPRRRYRR